jgi:hypothetical protein
VYSVDGQLHQHQHERPDIWSKPEIQAAREAKRAAAAAGTRTAKQAAAVAPVSVTKVPTLKAKPVLHLPAINR